MLLLLQKSLVVWLCIAAAETLHGILRIRLLNRRLGDHRARQVGVFTGSFLILLITWLLMPWLELRSASQALAVGGFLTLLMLLFDVALGRFYLRLRWTRILADFDVRKGGLLGLGMLVLFAAPWLTGWWRGLF